MHGTGSVIWRLEYRNMASPAARLLNTDVNEPGLVFALFGRVGRSPRVFAARDREVLLRELQTAALKKMGITLAGQEQYHVSAYCHNRLPRALIFVMNKWFLIAKAQSARPGHCRPNGENQLAEERWA